MKNIFRFFNLLTELLQGICLVLVLALPVTVFFKVFFRYVVGSPLVWSDEVIMLMLLTLTYFGAALAAHNRSHVNVEILESLIKGRSERALRIYHVVLDSVFLVVLSVIVYFGIRISFYSSDQVTDIMMISYFWVYSILPLGLLFMILMILKRIYEDWTGAEKQLNKTGWM